VAGGHEHGRAGAGIERLTAMLGWHGKGDSHPSDPMRDPASAAKLLAELRRADPLTALRDLGAWLEELKDIPGDEEGVRSEILARVQEASDLHVSRLLAQFVARTSESQAARESNWNALNHYLRGLTGALCASARHLLQQAAADPSLQLAAAAGAARGLHACRLMAKLYLFHYLGVPPKLWHLAYAVHHYAEKAGCEAKPVRLHAAQHTPTTVTQELLRLLMLQAGAPEMMAPEQIEAADRAIERFGGDFTLRPQGSSDGDFRFDPSGDQPPRRVADAPPEPVPGSRYFGAAMGFDALQRLHGELAKMKAGEVRPFGKDIPPHAQMSAIRHLLSFWGHASPFTAPAHVRAAGRMQVLHGYAPLWQHLSRAGSATSGLTLAEDGGGPAQAPETWTLREAGGNELGAEIPPRSGDWARSGDVVGVTMDGDGPCWLGVIRSMHAEPGRGTQANIVVMSRAPQAVQLRPVIEPGEANAFTEKAAQQFAFANVNAIILADGSAGSQRANFLLPSDHGEAGRIYEGTVAGAVRHLRGLQVLRHGDDYVRMTFEWVP
jgi:hypothetical protein